MRILVVSSYPPEENGLAEFNNDLLREIHKVDPKLEFYGIAINADADSYKYKPNILGQIRKHKLEDYAGAADVINNSSADLVILEHEFGQFGGHDGDHVISLLSNIKKKVLLIAHTVPVRSDTHHLASRRAFFTNTHKYVSAYITFLEEGRNTLASYGISKSRIHVIPHATPDIRCPHKPNIGRALKLFSFGFFHPNKGHTYAVEAIASVKKQGVKCEYTIVGQTLNNPVSKSYLARLKGLVEKHGLEDCVKIRNHYMQRAQLYEYICDCDLGIVPYQYHSYTASGPLSFFIGAAKPTITTRFAYARSIFTADETIFASFRSSESIAEAVVKVDANRPLLERMNANVSKLRDRLLWPRLAPRYVQVINSLS